MKVIGVFKGVFLDFSDSFTGSIERFEDVFLVWVTSEQALLQVIRVSRDVDDNYMDQKGSTGNQ